MRFVEAVKKWLRECRARNPLRDLENSPYYQNFKQLEQETESFFAENEKVLTIKRLEVRQCYDSKWEVVLLLDGIPVRERIIRHDFETLLGLARCLMSVETVTDLQALDMRERIYYD